MNLFEMLPLLEGWKYHAEVFDYIDEGYVGKTINKSDRTEILKSDEGKGWVLGGTGVVSDKYLDIIFEIDGNETTFSPYSVNSSIGTNPNNFAVWVASYINSFETQSGTVSDYYSLVYSPAYPIPFKSKWVISARLRPTSSSSSAYVYGYALAMILIDDEEMFKDSIKQLYEDTGIRVGGISIYGGVPV
jgi:hypothetical protein